MLCRSKKALERDGYDAVQVGFEDSSAERKLNKPQLGHLKKRGRSLRLWRAFDGISKVLGELCRLGSLFKVEIFSKGRRYWSMFREPRKGKGFQGVIKRHNYAGGPASHGSMFHRAPGIHRPTASYPSSEYGKIRHLPGQMGNKRVTVQGLKIVEVKPEENLL